MLLLTWVHWRRQRLPPRQGVFHRHLDRAELQALGDSSVILVWHRARRRLAPRDPHGNVLPGRYPMFLEKGGRNPCQRGFRGARGYTGVEQVLYREHAARPERVEDPDGAAFDYLDGPLGEIAHVDELDRVESVAGREGLASALNPYRPIGEPVRRILRPDDEPGPDSGRPAGQRRFRGLFAQRLQRAIALRSHLLDRGILDRRQRRALIDAGLAHLRVDGNRGDEDVLSDVRREQLGGHTHQPWDIAGGVDHGVPPAALERIELPVPIAPQDLDVLRVREQLRPGLPAVEERERVSARSRRPDELWPDEPGASKNEDRLRHAPSRHRGVTRA